MTTPVIGIQAAELNMRCCPVCRNHFVTGDTIYEMELEQKAGEVHAIYYHEYCYESILDEAAKKGLA